VKFGPRDEKEAKRRERREKKAGERKREGKSRINSSFVFYSIKFALIGVQKTLK
jgi:hypothetical protein